MGGFAQIYRGFCKLGEDTDTGLKAPNGVNFNLSVIDEGFNVLLFQTPTE